MTSLNIFVKILSLTIKEKKMETSYNIKETAEMLGIKVRTVREWIRNRKIKAFKYPNSRIWRIKESEIKRLINGEE